MRRLRRAASICALLATLAAAGACGLGFEPGEYASVRGTKDDAAVAPAGDGSVTIDGDVPVAPDGGARVILVGGRRDPFGNNDFSPYVAETLLLSVSETGALVASTYDRSPPSATSYQNSLLRNGNVYVFNGGAVYRAPLADRLGSDWQIFPQKNGGVSTSGARPWLVSEKGLVAAGGQGNDGGFTVWTTTVYFAPIDYGDAGFGPWVQSSSTLVKARQETTLYAYKKFLYAIGGRDSFCSNCPSREEVEVATLGDDGQPGPFAATEKMINPATSQPLGIVTPTVIAGAGHLFVIGGSLDQSGKSSDVVLAAPIDENAGTLGKWKGLPLLPGPLSGAAAIVLPRNLVVIGGAGATSLSDAILALEIKPDGTFGTEWKRVGNLPAGRAGIVAEVY